jgi:hypothetical protein
LYLTAEPEKEKKWLLQEKMIDENLQAKQQSHRGALLRLRIGVERKLRQWKRNTQTSYLPRRHEKTTFHSLHTPVVKIGEKVLGLCHSPVYFVLEPLKTTEPTLQQCTLK